MDYKILYDNKNITADISRYLLSLTYTDKVAGEADTLELELEDADNLWQNEWFPTLGATLSAEINNGERLLPCGSFYLDEVAFNADHAGDVVSLRGVSAFFSKKLRTKHSKAHENKTLGEIARTVAQKHGFTVMGEIANFPIGRVTQNRKGDLSFLQDLANEYGYIFSVKNNLMVFTDITKLEGASTVMSIDKSECISVNIKDKTSETYKRANVNFHNPSTKENIRYSSSDDDETDSADTMEIRSKAENQQQAERKGKAALHLANSTSIEGSIECIGNPMLLSGVNIELTGCGKLSGLYHITQSQHKATKQDGYTTSAEIKKVGTISPALFISKKRAKPVVSVPVPVETRTNRDNVSFNFIGEAQH